MSKIDLPNYCVGPTEAVTKEGIVDCDHDWKKTEYDEDVKFECSKCGKVVWYEVAQ